MRQPPLLLRAHAARSSAVLRLPPLEWMRAFVPAGFASPSTVYVFDYQCNASRCTVGDMYAMGPASATCDLMANGCLRLIDAHYDGERQWAICQDPHERSPGAGLDRTCTGAVPKCTMRWTTHRLQEAFEAEGKASLGARERGGQKEICQEHGMRRGRGDSSTTGW